MGQPERRGARLARKSRLSALSVDSFLTGHPTLSLTPPILELVHPSPLATILFHLIRSSLPQVHVKRFYSPLDHLVRIFVEILIEGNLERAQNLLQPPGLLSLHNGQREGRRPRC